MGGTQAGLGILPGPILSVGLQRWARPHAWCPGPRVAARGRQSYVWVLGASRKASLGEASELGTSASRGSRGLRPGGAAAVVQDGLASLGGLLQPGAVLLPEHQASEAGYARCCASCALARGRKRDAPQPKWSWPFHCMSSGGPSGPHTAAAGLPLPSTLLPLPAALNSVSSCGV